MILAKCKDCNNLFWAAVITGEVSCPKCDSKNTCVAIYEREEPKNKVKGGSLCALEV